MAWRLPPSMNQIGAAEAAWRRRSESPRHHDSPSSLTGWKDRQTVSLSATIACPRDLWAFFRPHVSESYLAIVAEGGERPIDAAVRIERARVISVPSSAELVAGNTVRFWHLPPGRRSARRRHEAEQPASRMVSSSTIRPSVEITGCEILVAGARYLRGYEHPGTRD